jgi:hypothetical protein
MNSAAVARQIRSTWVHQRVDLGAIDPLIDDLSRTSSLARRTL